MTQPLISSESFYKYLLFQLAFIMYLVSIRLFVNPLKDKVTDKLLKKRFANHFKSIILIILYIDLAYSINITTKLATDVLWFLIAAIYLVFIIVKVAQDWQQVMSVLKIIFENKVLTKKILNYSGLWIALVILGIYRALTGYCIILGLWMILLLIEFKAQSKHKSDAGCSQ